jgi:hypothetical protein
MPVWGATWRTARKSIGIEEIAPGRVSWARYVAKYSRMTTNFTCRVSNARSFNADFLLVLYSCRETTVRSSTRRNLGTDRQSMLGGPNARVARATVDPTNYADRSCVSVALTRVVVSASEVYGILFLTSRRCMSILYADCSNGSPLRGRPRCSGTDFPSRRLRGGAPSCVGAAVMLHAAKVRSVSGILPSAVHNIEGLSSRASRAHSSIREHF